ncbi:hypothetical protein SAMN05216196_10259 [Lutimaribacter pacificus]|uniref:Antifreeze protein n=1 Tax=Lutimaribacter pacificus TaxID=391948 RepID=A0A1H0E2K6_9RHOB|nr:antifreeze protein [Lutimaribacter pacificus]SDN76569.1 hypothetical protein SAMN05216196_10259 [Lutimaribacter pacificus]SHK57187.1 hypothetical protein SAMN05444142_106229 [Lutimaribacter pacificus]
MWTPDRFLGPWTLALELSRAMIDAQAVVAMRLGGMAGFWAVSSGETTRMITEKPRALFKAQWAMQKALLEGQPPDAILRAGLKPIRKKVGQNARRLAARGPKLP